MITTDDTQPVIATATMNADAQQYFDTLRTRHFPARLNYLKAHITLFHKLPAAELQNIRMEVKKVSGAFPITATAQSIYSLGRGVAIRIDCEKLLELRRRFSEKWEPWLSPQDRQDFRPHITIQNKVSPEDAKNLMLSMEEIFRPFTFTISGISLWRYLGGPWETLD